MRKYSIFIGRTTIAFLVVVFFPLASFADLPIERFMKGAFVPGIIEKWQQSKGILSISLAEERTYIIRKHRNDESEIVKEFRVYPDSGIPVDYESESWHAYVAGRVEMIKQLPFFVSAFGYGDEIPGMTISLPVLDWEGGWVLVYADWECKEKGWIKVSSQQVLSFSHIRRQAKEGVFLTTRLVALEPAPIYTADKQKTIWNINSLEYSDKTPEWWKNLYIHLRVEASEIQRGWIPITWQYEKHLVKASDVYLIRWIQHDSGD